MDCKRFNADKILRGSFERLPKPPLMSIRVFFSSTFTDMTEDRNILMNKSVPEIRKYSHEKGFDFEVVDMRWGVREDAYADHMTTDICLKEIENCQHTSAGPNFVLFIGDKYGTRPLPNTIPVTEFRLFRRLASWMDMKFETMEKWYLLDTNSVPPVYHILPITTHLAYYSDMEPANERNRIIHHNIWESEEKKMKIILRKLAQVSLEQKKITKKDHDKYFISVTQNEIEKGIFTYPKLKDRVLCFHRTLVNINILDQKAKRFIDLMDDGKIDEQASQLREILQHKLLPATVPENQIKKFMVTWSPDGIDPNIDEHKKYLLNLCECFENLMKKQINICKEHADEEKIENPTLAEALVHLQFCLTKCQCFFGQEDIVNKVYKIMHSSDISDNDVQTKPEETGSNLNDEEKKLLTIKRQEEIMQRLETDQGPTLGIGDLDYDIGYDPEKNIKYQLTSFSISGKVNQPVILYGESGCGKTSLMAKLAITIKTRCNSAVLIIRFLGTTSLSSNIRSLLVSILNNIWSAYKINKPADLDLNSDIIFLGHYLQALIWQAASSDHPLYIFLDSLDQLSQLEQAHRLAWLPTILPEHASVVVSILPHEHGCLDSARQRFPKTDYFVHVTHMKTQDADKVITEICNSHSRTLTRLQRNFLLEKFQLCPNPLYLRMIINQSLKWRSHQEVKDLVLGSNTNFAINHVFIDLEREHDRVIVSKALGYFTSMKQGVTMLEMEDFLSLDNEVLQNAYIYHLPPDPDFIRLPPSLWARIMMDIKEYMAGEGVGGRLVLTWYHRLFKLVAAERYLNEENMLPIHRVAAEYFLGYWHNRCKPLNLNKGKSGTYPYNFRGVPKQPLVFMDGSLNMRKLQELPYHLAMGRMWIEFHQHIVCNIEWLVTKVKAFGVSELKADLLRMLEQRKLLTEKYSPLEITGNSIKIGHQDAITETKSDPNDNKIKEVNVGVDLSTALKDLGMLINIVSMGVDSIRHSPNNLPVQIICQLGKHRAMSWGMKKLVADCYKWLENNNIPLLIPEDACMMPPGGMLQTTLNVDVHLLGEDRTHDFPALHVKKENYLYLIQQVSRQKDSFVVLDLKQSGEKVIVEEVHNYVHSIKTNVSESLYKQLGKYDYKLFSQLYERGYLSPYVTESEASSIDVTADGELVAYTCDNLCYVCVPNSEKLTLTTLHQLKLEEKALNVLFSLDAHYLVTFVSNDGFTVWLPKEGLTAFSNEASKKVNFSSRDKSGQVVYITSSNKLLQVKSHHDEQNSMNVFDLTTGALLFQLKSSDLHYTINFLELDKKEDLVLVFSEEDIIVNGNRNKSAVLWDIGSGKQISVVTSISPITATKITIIDNIIYIFMAVLRDSTVYVYNAGYRQNPNSEAQLIQQIKGHTKDIIQILLAPGNSYEYDRLITVSADNSVKIWNLQEVLKPSAKSDSVDIGASTHLVYNKDASIVYFTTNKGFILQNCMLTGVLTHLDKQLSHAAHILLLSQDGTYLLLAVKNNVIVYNLQTGIKVFTLNSCGSSKISCLDENHNILLAGHAGMNGQGRLWNLKDGTVIRDISFLYSFYNTAISPNGKNFGITLFEYPLAMSINEDAANQLNLNMEQIDTLMSACAHLKFSPNAKMLVSASSDGRIRIVDAETGRYLHCMIQKSSVTAMLMTSDSQHLLTGGYRTVYIWNIGPQHSPKQQGQLLVKLTPHTNFITCMQLVRGDSHLVTASLDKTIAVWSLSSRTTVCTFQYHCSIDVMVAAPDLSSIAFIPEKSPTIGVLTLNKAGKEALTRAPSLPVTEKLLEAQAVALAFSSPQIYNTSSSATCSIY